MTEHARPKPSIAKSAGIVGAAVMISRILGLLREKAIAYYFAAGIGGVVILAAFRIPNLLRDLFAEEHYAKPDFGKNAIPSFTLLVNNITFNN